MNDERRLAEILRAAGPRPEMPAGTAERLRSAARFALERRAARRRRVRSMRWLAAAAMVATVLLAARFVPWPGGSSAVVAEVVHVVGVGVGGRVAPGSAVGVGEWLETGPGTSLALQASTGHSIRIAPDSRARFTTARDVELERGALYVDSGDGAAAETVGIETAYGRVEELGTRYLVQVDASSLAVRVRDGRVAVEHDDKRFEAGAGFELVVDASGVAAPREIAFHGAGWEWILAAAPAPAIEGRPLAELLDWVVRETGWRLEYADPATAARAPGIELRGSSEGLTPSTALETILPTCGLTHELRSGTLIVGASPQE